jgi:hypothetical protein
VNVISLDSPQAVRYDDILVKLGRNTPHHVIRIGDLLHAVKDDQSHLPLGAT